MRNQPARLDHDGVALFVGCERVGFVRLAVAGRLIAFEFARRAEVFPHHVAQYVIRRAVFRQPKDCAYPAGRDSANPAGVPFGAALVRLRVHVAALSKACLRAANAARSLTLTTPESFATAMPLPSSASASGVSAASIVSIHAATSAASVSLVASTSWVSRSASSWPTTGMQ